MTLAAQPTEVGTITVQLPVPPVGKTMECEVDGLYILVENIRDAEPEASYDVQITEYVAVRNPTPTGYAIHAAVLGGGPVKRRRATHTLCSRDGSRKSGPQLPGGTLEDVTCAQCRERLIRAGALTA